MALLHFAVGERTRLMTKFIYVTMSSYNLLDPVDVITEKSAELRQLDWLNNTDSLNSCGLITSTKLVLLRTSFIVFVLHISRSPC